ncbi:helix-turn-helix domain-containing protein [Catalinimonas niigatensis]|uniref:hypothetical protein n=1 Tax=Catalinimonas niigatensis TaxID=1397264 RepID=UPI002665750B|nr:hypothetical protein [Catalinimonas niigatensis]WPP48910.1 hypothetical protein PZB72_19785 [Catalinimonas niigatensis]
MKKLRKKIPVTVEKTNTGYSAYANDYSIYTTGKTVADLLNHTVEAVNLYFEEEGLFADASNIQFMIDWQHFFQDYKIINAKLLAERIGLNASLLSQYAQGKKKPSPKQQQKILEGIHQIGQELAEMNLIIR